MSLSISCVIKKILCAYDNNVSFSAKCVSLKRVWVFINKACRSEISSFKKLKDMARPF